jgi:hypothetical protein
MGQEKFLASGTFKASNRKKGLNVKLYDSKEMAN